MRCTQQQPVAPASTARGWSGSTHSLKVYRWLARCWLFPMYGYCPTSPHSPPPHPALHAPSLLATLSVHYVQHAVTRPCMARKGGRQAAAPAPAHPTYLVVRHAEVMRLKQLLRSTRAHGASQATAERRGTQLGVCSCDRTGVLTRIVRHTRCIYVMTGHTTTCAWQRAQKQHQNANSKSSQHPVPAAVPRACSTMMLAPAAAACRTSCSALSCAAVAMLKSCKHARARFVSVTDGGWSRQHRQVT